MGVDGSLLPSMKFIKRGGIGKAGKHARNIQPMSRSCRSKKGRLKPKAVSDGLII